MRLAILRSACARCAARLRRRRAKSRPRSSATGMARSSSPRTLPQQGCAPRTMKSQRQRSYSSERSFAATKSVSRPSNVAVSDVPSISSNRSIALTGASNSTKFLHSSIVSIVSDLTKSCLSRIDSTILAIFCKNCSADNESSTLPFSCIASSNPPESVRAGVDPPNADRERTRLFAHRSLVHRTLPSLRDDARTLCRLHPTRPFDVFTRRADLIAAILLKRRSLRDNSPCPRSYLVL